MIKAVVVMVDQNADYEILCTGDVQRKKEIEL